MEKVKLTSGQVIIMHERSVCSGSCPVHNPSEHHMRSFKLLFRPDRDIFERVCEHGVGHPDPDSLIYLRGFMDKSAADAGAIHGCDGCCRPPEDKSNWRPTDAEEDQMLANDYNKGM